MKRNSVGGMSLRRKDPNVIGVDFWPPPKKRDSKKPANYDWIPGWCAGKEVFILGGDGSLFGFEFGMLKDRKNSAVVCVNNSIADAPFADAMTFLDPSTKRTCGIENLSEQKFRVVCGTNGNMDPRGNVTVLQPVTRLTDHPSEGIYSTITSSHMAMTLAIWGRASRIYLLGISSNQFGKSMLMDYEGYTRDNPWYPNHEEDMLRLEQWFEKKVRLQHYYGMSRIETRAGDSSAYFHMAKSFSAYREHSQKIFVCNFMSRLPFRQLSIGEVKP